MGGDIPFGLQLQVTRVLTEWAVNVGLVMVEKYLAIRGLCTKESVDLIMSMLLEGMVDSACPVLLRDGMQVSEKIRNVLDTMSRRILGSIEQQCSNFSLGKDRASRLNAAWRQLQIARRSFYAQAKKEQKDQQRTPQSQVMLCIMLIHQIRTCVENQCCGEHYLSTHP